MAEGFGSNPNLVQDRRFASPPLPKWKSQTPQIAARVHDFRAECEVPMPPLFFRTQMSPRKPIPRDPVEILLVEDSPSDIRLVQEAFRESGFSSRLNVARDGEHALAFLRQQGEYSQSPRP